MQFSFQLWLPEQRKQNKHQKLKGALQNRVSHVLLHCASRAIRRFIILSSGLAHFSPQAWLTESFSDLPRRCKWTGRAPEEEDWVHAPHRYKRHLLAVNQVSRQSGRQNSCRFIQGIGVARKGDEMRVPNYNNLALYRQVNKSSLPDETNLNKQ